MCNYSTIIRKKCVEVIIYANKMESITDDEIYEYACCPTKFYLAKSKKSEDNDESVYLTHISELIEKNRERICNSLNPTKFSETEKSVFSETNKLMKKGENLIRGAVLCTNGLLARPFLLEKVPLYSNIRFLTSLGRESNNLAGISIS